MAKKKKKVVKKKPARTKTKVAPSKEPGVDLDVMLKRKPAKKVVKTKIKKPKARKADTLPPLVITPRGSKYGDEPFVRRRKIPKDVTKRTPLKRKVPKRKSAVERERRVQFAKDNPLMPRKPTPRSRSPLGVGILSPIRGPVSRLIGKGAKKLLQSKRAKSTVKKAVRPRLKKRKSKK